MESLWKPLLVEFVGTFLFVLVGAGAASLTLQQGGSDLAIAFAFGLAFVALFYTWNTYSGAHFNPAVSFGFATAGRMGWGRMFLYWIAQILGAIAAGALILYLFGLPAYNGTGSLTNTDVLRTILIEAFMTFFFVLVFLFITRNSTYSMVAGLAIGLAFTAAMIPALSLTGASFNPARSIGTGIFNGDSGSIWLYIVGPLLGALVAGLIYRLFTICWKAPTCSADMSSPPKQCPAVAPEKDCDKPVTCCEPICKPVPQIDKCNNPCGDGLDKLNPLADKPYYGYLQKLAPDGNGINLHGAGIHGTVDKTMEARIPYRDHQAFVAFQNHKEFEADIN